MNNNSVFLVASYHMHPVNKNKTSIKHYLSLEENCNWEEKIEVVTKIKPRHLTNCKVILDIVNERIVKNAFRLEENRTYEDFITHYYSKHKEQLSEILHLIQRQKVEMFKNGNL